MFFTVITSKRHFYLLLLFLCRLCLSLAWEAKSSIKVEDEASPWIYLYAFIVSLYINPSFICHACSFHFNFVRRLYWLCRSCLFIVFNPMDTFHLSIYVHLSIVFCVNHIHIGSFGLSRICFVFCQMDRCFKHFNRHDRTCIGRKNVWTSVTLEHA